jgi:hypothetical protein
MFMQVVYKIAHSNDRPAVDMHCGLCMLHCILPYSSRGRMIPIYCKSQAQWYARYSSIMNGIECICTDEKKES